MFLAAHLFLERSRRKVCQAEDEGTSEKSSTAMWVHFRPSFIG